MTSPARPMADDADHAERALESLQAPAVLATRLSIAKGSMLSGLTKIRDGDPTLALFMDEYRVPLLPPHVVAPPDACSIAH